MKKPAWLRSSQPHRERRRFHADIATGVHEWEPKEPPLLWSKKHKSRWKRIPAAHQSEIQTPPVD